MKNNDDISPIIIFSGSMWEAGMVKSLLDDAEIECFMNDENRNGYYPISFDANGVTKIVVSSKDAEQARLIVEDFKKNTGRD